MKIHVGDSVKGLNSQDTLLLLPREAVDAPSLAVPKARLDGALGNPVWWEVSLPMAGGLELDDP